MWQIDEEAQISLENDVLGALAIFNEAWLNPQGSISLADVQAPLLEFQRVFGDRLRQWHIQPGLNDGDTQEVVFQEVDTLDFASQAALNEMASISFLPPLGMDEDGPLFLLPPGLPANITLTMLLSPMVQAKRLVSDMMHSDDYSFPVNFFKCFLEFAQALRICGVERDIAEDFSRIFFCELLEREHCNEMVIYKILSKPDHIGAHFNMDHGYDDAEGLWMAEARRILYESEQIRSGHNSLQERDKASILEVDGDEYELLDGRMLNAGIFSSEMQRARRDAYHAAALAGIFQQETSQDYGWLDFMRNLLISQDNQIFGSK